MLLKTSKLKFVSVFALFLASANLPISELWAQGVAVKSRVNPTSNSALTPTLSNKAMLFSVEDDKAVRKVFMNNQCAATFVPEDVAENTLKILIEEGGSRSLLEDLGQRGYAWNGNARNQNYIAIYPVLAAIVRGTASNMGAATANIREVLGGANLVEVNQSILENSAPFRSKVEALGAAGFRFQIDAGQSHIKMGDLGLRGEQENNAIENLAAQLGYLTKNEQGVYFDSAFFAAYLSEVTKQAVKASANLGRR